LIETFRNRPLVSPPGAKWAYTNTEYYLLAYVLEKLTNQSYGSYLADQIFRPLGMLHSGFDPTSAIIPKMAEGYTRDQSKLRKRDCFDRSVEVGAGGIHTTARDLLLWDHALNGPGLLSRESLIAMFTVHPPGPYGYGWFIEGKPVRKIYHQGGDPGFAAFEARYPDQRLVILVLSNEDDAPVREIADAIANTLSRNK
jgi:D-alanyl-D-alanine carboxypeptidase